MTGEKQTILDSWSCISEKTVFILDRSEYFTKVSSGHSINGDCLKDSKKTAHLYSNQPTIEPFDRSLWTCTVEAVVGYSRLVWDLFTPDQRCISILSARSVQVTDDATTSPHIERICNWRDDHQNLDHMLKSLARSSHSHQIRSPQRLLQTKDIAQYPNCLSDSPVILEALNQALNELSQLTNAQIERKCPSSPDDTPASPIESNNGRIILISSFQDDQTISEIISKLETMLNKKNETWQETAKQNIGTSTSVGTQISPINYCDLVVVNTFPIEDEGSCSEINISSDFKPNLHCRIYSVKSGRNIAGLLNNLCLQHHNLRSTTITGIPMKEEQNASSSSQYDVEIVHCSSIHEDLINSGSSLLDGVIEIIDRNGFPCDTFKLSWCTPRTTTIELNHCIATSRITAVDVNSRPSACLTNFLLNGRAVMLEIFKSKSNRVTTHILASHNGELYIHSLAAFQRKINVGDPPSITDHLGGKVNDYRVNDFVNFMKQHTLTRSHLVDNPLSKTCNIIKRQTLYWPLTLGHTILWNVPNLSGRLLQLIPKDTLTHSEVEDCKRNIDSLFKSEAENQALPSVSIAEVIKSATSKGSKLDQLYKLFWNELEYFLRVHNTSTEHGLVLDYLMAKRKPAENERGTKRAASKSSAVSLAGQSQHSLAKKAKLSSQLLPELHETGPHFQQTTMYYKTGMTLWQTWTQLYHLFHRNKNKLPFVGRMQQQQPTE